MHYRMSCQIASVAHFLPPQIDVEVSQMADDDEVQWAMKKAAEDHTRDVLHDEATRDIVWPVEKVNNRRMSPVQRLIR